MSHVFVSYRRDDTAEMACMLSELMQLKFGAGSVFFDVSEIPLGADFKHFINGAVAKCKIVLAIIGDNWLATETGTSKRRIDDPEDTVRTEIKAALERRIPVIPVLVNNAKMPSAAELPAELQALAYRHAAELRSGGDLRHQVNNLFSQLAAYLQEKPTSDQAAGNSDAAELPAELEALAYRHAAELRSGRDLSNQLNTLISQLDLYLASQTPTRDRNLPDGIQLRHLLTGHEDVINRIAWSPDGKLLASPSADESVRIWDSYRGIAVCCLSTGASQSVTRMGTSSRWISSVSWSPDGSKLVCGSGEGIVRVWDVDSQSIVRTFEHHGKVLSVDWSPRGKLLATGSSNGTIQIVDTETAQIKSRFTNSSQRTSGSLVEFGLLSESVYCIAWSPDGELLASASADGTLRVFDASGNEQMSIDGHSDRIYSVAWFPDGKRLVTGSADRTVRVFDVLNGAELVNIEAFAFPITCVCVSADGRFVAATESGQSWRALDQFPQLRTHDLNLMPMSRMGKSEDSSVEGAVARLWSSDTWEEVATLSDSVPGYGFPSAQFHPSLPILATLGRSGCAIRVWDLQAETLLRSVTHSLLPPAVHHMTARVVLVGDSGVGKSGLGWRLAHGEYKEHSSTHGQQYWVLRQLCRRDSQGTQCEAILWDLAGQPDYRLTHSLFLDDADLVLVLFDPSDGRDPLHGVDFWLKQLGGSERRSVQSTVSAHHDGETSGYANGPEVFEVSAPNAARVPTILVGARCDRGAPTLTDDELKQFCEQRSIDGGFVLTSARDDVNLDNLVNRMTSLIHWDQKSKTVTTQTFKRIKDYVLGLKESDANNELLVNAGGLRNLLAAAYGDWRFNEDEMRSAVGHLETYGYVRVLRTSAGKQWVLLVPELLNNLAASIVLEARRNAKGLGSLEEERLLSAGYQFREVENLKDSERKTLLDSVVLAFLEHNVCFRDTGPGKPTYLVFPELINLKKPQRSLNVEIEDGVSYKVSGAIQNVYASLVVLLGYTNTFTRTDQWHNHARYEVGDDGQVCGFHQVTLADGDLEFVLYFGTNVTPPNRTLFQGLFAGFLERRKNLSVSRIVPVACPKCGERLERQIVYKRLAMGKEFTHCPECGELLRLPSRDEPIQEPSRETGDQMELQRRTARCRSQFEQVIFQVRKYAGQNKDTKRPKCFISYAWGEKKHERWVRDRLCPDLLNAGVEVLLDVRDNAEAGRTISSFVEQIDECDFVLVIGTLLYQQKYSQRRNAPASIVATEILQINNMLARDPETDRVKPLLLSGDPESSFPPQLQGRVRHDFRDQKTYFTNAFDLIRTLYRMPKDDNTLDKWRRNIQAAQEAICRDQ